MSITSFCKENFKKGQTVYLLRIGDEARRTIPENWIFSAIVKTVGRKYITVSQTGRDIRFGYDETKQQIWHDTSYNQEYELYLTKAEADDVLEKRVLQKEILQQINKIRCMELTELSLEQLHLLKRAITDIPVMSETEVRKYSDNEYQAFLWNSVTKSYKPIGRPVGNPLVCKGRLEEMISKRYIANFDKYDTARRKICTRTVYPVITNWKDVKGEN